MASISVFRNFTVLQAVAMEAAAGRRPRGLSQRPPAGELRVIHCGTVHPATTLPSMSATRPANGLDALPALTPGRRPLRPPRDRRPGSPRSARPRRRIDLLEDVGLATAWLTRALSVLPARESSWMPLPKQLLPDPDPLPGRRSHLCRRCALLTVIFRAPRSHQEPAAQC